jgi:hypothetical protein
MFYFYYEYHYLSSFFGIQNTQESSGNKEKDEPKAKNCSKLGASVYEPYLSLEILSGTAVTIKSKSNNLVSSTVFVVSLDGQTRGAQEFKFTFIQ